LLAGLDVSYPLCHGSGNKGSRSKQYYPSHATGHSGCRAGGGNKQAISSRTASDPAFGGGSYKTTAPENLPLTPPAAAPPSAVRVGCLPQARRDQLPQPPIRGERQSNHRRKGGTDRGMADLTLPSPGTIMQSRRVCLGFPLGGQWLGPRAARSISRSTRPIVPCCARRGIPSARHRPDACDDISHLVPPLPPVLSSLSTCRTLAPDIMRPAAMAGYLRHECCATLDRVR